MKKKKTAQIATEYLMTYGWALMIIAITVGAFTYLEFRPERNIPSDCFFSEDFNCVAHNFNSSGINMEVVNTVGRNINITRIDCTVENIYSTTGYSEGITLSPGEQKIITCGRSDLGSFGVNIKADVLVYFEEEFKDFPQVSEGRVTGNFH